MSVSDFFMGGKQMERGKAGKWPLYRPEWPDDNPQWHRLLEEYPVLKVLCYVVQWLFCMAYLFANAVTDHSDFRTHV